MAVNQTVRDVVCIDLKSFYASVECVKRGLDPFKTPLIVADETRGGGSIVLAVSPYLKKQGIPGRLRLFEMPKVNGLIIAKPRMQAYIDVAKTIIDIYLDFVAEEDLHIYSVDEVFLDLTDYLAYYETDVVRLTKTIMRTIYDKTRIPSAAGIGDNVLLSKLALDLKSKQSKTHIATMRQQDVARDLWPLRPLSKMWGIGPRMEKRFNLLNIFTVGDLAHANRETLSKLFGIIGDELYFHAHGIDESIIKNKHHDMVHGAQMKSVGLGQTLFKDYDATMIFPIILEMCDEVCERLRFIRQEARTIHLSIAYGKETGGGFSRQLSFDHPTDVNEDVLQVVLSLFETYYEGLPIRRISIRATKLNPKRHLTQVSLFEPVERGQKSKALFSTIDRIKVRFGKESALRLTSYLEHATAKNRATMIGGHHA